jgi:hypothetical protein
MHPVPLRSVGRPPTLTPPDVSGAGDHIHRLAQGSDIPPVMLRPGPDARPGP